MLQELLRIYDSSRTNPGPPECAWAETLVFNEGWLLRGVIQEWKRHGSAGRFPFLPLPQGTRVYSEAQLYTPFKARYQGDKLAEGHTHVDGIVGDFEFSGGTKSGVALLPHWRYLAVMEAKMYSPLSGGVQHAPDYDQVSRTTACMIHTILQAGGVGDRTAHLIVLYPADNQHIQPQEYTTDRIAEQIAQRVQPYLVSGHHKLPVPFLDQWQIILQHIQIWFVTWEAVLDEMHADEMRRFYGLCRQFNQPPNKILME